MVRMGLCWGYGGCGEGGGEVGCRRCCFGCKCRVAWVKKRIGGLMKSECF